MTTVIVGVVCLLVGGGLGWWIGKKGAANVEGDIKVAVQDISKVVKK